MSFECRLEVRGAISRAASDRRREREHWQGKAEEYLWVEREEGRFMRTVRLPGAIQEGKIAAVYHDGILTVRMPKAEPPVKNRIAIK